MQKLLLRVGSIILLLYSCQGVEVEEKTHKDIIEITKDSTIVFPNCFLKMDTLLPDDSLLEKHITRLGDYIFDSIPEEAKRGFREKKYYFYFDVKIDYSLIDKYDVEPYMDYMNELTKLLHLPMGTIDGYPIADTYFTYTPLYTEKGDSSFIEISVKQK